jgi:pimeloyl-ACP methyl ester carboxylesterase
MKSILIAILLIAIVFPLLVIATVVVRAALKPALNDEFRKEGLGNYVELSRGVVHYEFNSVDTTAPVVVMVHGISVPMVVWNKTVPALNRAGFSTLRMDLYGRGYSDRPKTAYSGDLYWEEITELMDSLNITSPVHLVGVSLGGALSAYIANRTPSRIKSVTLIDPAISYRSEEGVDYVMRRLRKGVKAISSMIQNGGKEKRRYRHTADFAPHIKRQFQFKGVEFSLLSMAIHGDSESFLKSFRGLAAKDIPVQIIWGEVDHVLPLALGQRLAGEFNRAPFHVIPAAGHTPHYEKPDTVNSMLIDFFREHGLNSKSTIEGVEL